MPIGVLNAATIGEIDVAFAAPARERPDALFLAAGAFFISRRVQFSTLTAVNKIPAAYGVRSYVEAGVIRSWSVEMQQRFCIGGI